MKKTKPRRRVRTVAILTEAPLAQRAASESREGERARKLSRLLAHIRGSAAQCCNCNRRCGGCG